MSGARLPVAHGEPVTVPLPGELDIATAPGAGLDLAAVLWAGACVVIADLTRTTFCDGSGATMLASAHRAAIAAGAELRIASRPVRNVLWLTRLDVLLSVYPTLAAARAGLPPSMRP